MNILARDHILPLLTPGTESTITSTRIKMPNIGSEGFVCSSFLSTVKGNSRMIHFSSCFKTPVNPEQIIANPFVHKMTTMGEDDKDSKVCVLSFPFKY